MSDEKPDPPRRKRRPRYAGTHPRQFRDRYKELDPEAHGEEIAHVLASGRTPAGSHRPICVREVIEVLAPSAGEIAVDATLGHGGHALSLLPLLQPGGRLIGIDADDVERLRTEERLRRAGFGAGQLVTVNANHAGLPKVLEALGLEAVDLVLADLGCSSMQLDDPARGFTHRSDGPLDMRMNPERGAPASKLLARLSESRLARLFRENADLEEAELLARGIVEARSSRPLLRTFDLVQVIRSALLTLVPPRRPEASLLARVFQALRIEVNDEFSSLRTFLRALPSCLRPGGRVAVLSFHSGEDRLVKEAFREDFLQGLYSEIARNPIRAGGEEVGANPRAASAKLRWARRAGGATKA